jgi:hypothetical protein
MSEDYEDGYQAYIAGIPFSDAPGNWTDGHDMHPDHYYEWCSGWWSAEEQFGGINNGV